MSRISNAEHRKICSDLQAVKGRRSKTNQEFNRIPRWLDRRPMSEIGHTEKRVYGFIDAMERINGEYAYLSLGFIAENLGFSSSPSSIARAINRLIKLGLIGRMQRKMEGKKAYAPSIYYTIDEGEYRKMCEKEYAEVKAQYGAGGYDNNAGADTSPGNPITDIKDAMETVRTQIGRKVNTICMGEEDEPDEGLSSQKDKGVILTEGQGVILTEGQGVILTEGHKKNTEKKNKKKKEIHTTNHYGTRSNGDSSTPAASCVDKSGSLKTERRKPVDRDLMDLEADTPVNAVLRSYHKERSDAGHPFRKLTSEDQADVRHQIKLLIDSLGLDKVLSRMAGLFAPGAPNHPVSINQAVLFIRRPKLAQKEERTEEERKEYIINSARELRGLPRR